MEFKGSIVVPWRFVVFLPLILITIALGRFFVGIAYFFGRCNYYLLTQMYKRGGQNERVKTLHV